jgi:hypothetical protein
MADSKSSRPDDDGKGPPPAGGDQTTAHKSFDGRQVPGGSIEAARVPIGMNAVDRDQLPSGGLSPEQQRIRDTPEEPATGPGFKE